MNWPSIGAYRLNRTRATVIGAVLIDVLLTITGRLEALASLITSVLVVWGLWLLVRTMLRRTRLIWRLRNRLIVTYMFIAVVPIMLILGLAFVTGWLLTAQFAGYLVSSAMDRSEAAIEIPARVLARALPADRMAIAQQLTATGLRSFEVLVTGGETFRYPADAKIEMPPGDWKDYSGVVNKDDQPYLMALVNSGNNRALILAPLTPGVLTKLVPGLGSLRLPARSAGQSPASEDVDVQIPDGKRKGITITMNGRTMAFSNTVAGVEPPAYNMLDVDVAWFAPIQDADWDRPDSGSTSAMLGVTRLSAVLGVIFPSNIDASQNFLVAFYLIAGMLGVAWLFSFFIGVSMTRTITGAFHNLYEGTTRIGEGAFSHRIPVKGRDQLADLGRSFNKMAEQLEQYVVVTKEKERLQSEIAIASEVQTRLFPARPPIATTIEMLGVCHAARMVSGDYYDYFTAADGEVAVALGDVAGKGISAALLMASIQSIMRTQLSDGGAARTPAHAVARLNRLLYASTSPEKYATFFFGLYNEQTQRLNYTNAGHLPPLLIHGDDYEFLEVTGSVVGAFPSLHYEEQSVPLGPRDLLIAYTDGITEPENAYGEDFGAERLAEVVMQHRDAGTQELVARILDAVRHWDTAEEQADDMTLMIVRGIA